jgi:pectate lyase
VLAQAGCLPRDAVSKRAVQEVRTATGSWGRHDPEGGLMAGLTPGKPPVDSDSDGMPDAWEAAHGLNPKDPADAGRTVPAGASENDRHKGYTYIEFYINELADRLIVGT